MNLNNTQLIFYYQTERWAYLIPHYPYRYSNNLIKKYVTKVIIETIPNYSLKYQFFQNYNLLTIKKKQNNILLKDISKIIWQLKKSGLYKHIVISYVLMHHKLVIKLKCYFNPVIKKIRITGFHMNVITKKKLSQIIRHQLGSPENLRKFKWIIKKIKNEYDKEGYFWIKYDINSSKNKTNYTIEIIPYLIKSIEFNYSHYLNDYDLTFLKSFILTKLNLKIDHTLNYYTIQKGIVELRNEKLLFNCKYNIIYLSNNKIKVTINCVLKPDSLISILNYKLWRYLQYYSSYRNIVFSLDTYVTLIDKFKKIRLDTNRILNNLYSITIDKIHLDKHKFNLFVEKQKKIFSQNKDYYYFFLVYKYQDLVKNYYSIITNLYYSNNWFNHRYFRFTFNSYGGINYLIHNKRQCNIFRFIYLQRRSQNICHKVNIVNNNIFNQNIHLSKSIILYDCLHHDINTSNFNRKVNYYNITSIHYSIFTSRYINNNKSIDYLTFYYKHLFMIGMYYFPKNDIFLFRDFLYLTKLLYQKKFLYLNDQFNNSNKVLDVKSKNYLLIHNTNRKHAKYFQKQIKILTLNWLCNNHITYYICSSKWIYYFMHLHMSNDSISQLNNRYIHKSYCLELSFNLVTKIRPSINIQYKVYSNYRSKLYLYLFK